MTFAPSRTGVTHGIRMRWEGLSATLSCIVCKPVDSMLCIKFPGGLIKGTFFQLKLSFYYHRNVEKKF